MALIKCKECGETISKKADACPKCGAKNKSFKLGAFGWLIIIGSLAWLYTEITGQQEQTRLATAKQTQIQQQQNNFKNNKITVIAEIKQQIETKKFEEALKKINTYKYVSDTDLLKLKNTAREQIILSKLKTIPTSQTVENLKYYNELLTLQPNNTKYKTKKGYYNKIQIEQKAKQASRILLLGKKPIKDHWGGGYLEIEHYLKKTAHDPDSIKFSSCSDIFYTKNGWIVRCTYRGKNAFGAKIQNTHWFTIKHGAVIQQHESNEFSI
jgi:hypothetical protein